MTTIARIDWEKIRARRLALLLVTVCVSSFSVARAGQVSPPHEQTMPSADTEGVSKSLTDKMSDMGSSMTGGEPNGGLRWSDREWSIFNHRGAGWFLLFWGLSACIVGLQWPRRTSWRFVPPMLLFGLVEFLFLRNDPEAWPVGHIGPWESLRSPEVFQHRIFLLVLFLIALVELLRAADRLPGFLQKYALPALAVFGGIYLFFHRHGSPEMMHMQHMERAAMATDPGMRQMMASMDLVHHEHLWFSLLGFALAAAKLLADTGRIKGRWGATLWSVFAILLGAYMTGYTE